MKEDHQLEANLAFAIAAFALAFGLLVPGAGLPPLWRIWWEDVRLNLSHPSPPRMMVDVFFLGASVLWLVSPFLVRVYSRSGVLRMLALVLSAITVTATGFLFYLVPMKTATVCAILLAALAHLAGTFMVRKQEPQRIETVR
jgi:hypothetical protein